MKCSFIVSGFKCDEWIFRNIDSIHDQDYKDYEIIVVLNGEWETKGELIRRIHEQYGGKVRLECPERGGLGFANNLGFSLSVGDIVSFLSSDLYLMPGTLRTWVDAFKENPEHDFVYSGYKFVSDNPMDVFYSQQYDRYHLECENFIDGANPVRRGAVARWDEKLKSLIDWDFFLSVTDGGATGVYIKEPLYFAERPKKGGLSDDSSQNWKIRRAQIQDKHHIPQRSICITSLSDPVYGLELAKIAEADFINYPGYKPHDYKLIYCYGFPCDDDNMQTSTGVFFNHAGHKAIHWTGPDIRTLINHRWVDVDYYSGMVLKRIDNHFVYNAKDEQVLSRVGLVPEIIYPPVKQAENDHSTYAISINDAGLRDQLQKAIPDQEIRLNDLSCQITVHFEDRIDRVCESVSRGNQVVTNTFLPGVNYIQGFTNVPELRKMLVHAIRKILKDQKPVEEETVNEYRQKTNPSAFKRKLEKIAEKKLHRYGKLEDIAAHA